METIYPVKRELHRHSSILNNILKKVNTISFKINSIEKNIREIKTRTIVGVNKTK